MDPLIFFKHNFTYITSKMVKIYSHNLRMESVIFSRLLLLSIVIYTVSKLGGGSVLGTFPYVLFLKYRKCIVKSRPLRYLVSKSYRLPWYPGALMVAAAVLSLKRHVRLLI